jgi:hypothetical protein
MLDACFHRPFHQHPKRGHNLGVFKYHRTLSFGGAQLFQALLHDPHRLTHLSHPHQISVLAVAMLADRNANSKSE